MIEGKRLENGLELRTERVPIGVIAIVYEARPNVTDRRRGALPEERQRRRPARLRAAERSNAVLAGIVADALRDAGLPEAAVGLVGGGDRSEMAELATQEDTVDLIIPRGGEGLKAALKEVATVPVIYAAAGNCHVYVHADADLEMASGSPTTRRCSGPASATRPRRCSSTPTWRPSLLPPLLADLHGAGVELVGDERTRAAAGEIPVGEATEADWDTEYHGLKMAVGVVDSLEEAIEHVNRHGSGHSEAIVTCLRGGGEGVHRHGRRRRGLRQRLDPLHRRLRVRDGRRDRQLDPEAARPRPDRPARADHDQVRGPRRRPGPGVDIA